MDTKKRLVILSDYGLDDANALAYLLMEKERFDGIDIVCVGGNSSAESSFCNCEKLLSAYGGKLDDVRVIKTDMAKQNYECLPSIHGNDNMGDLFIDRKHDCPVLDYDDYVETIPANAVILSLGPCTLTIDILSRVGQRELVIMAGMVNEEPNFRGMEFNQALDVKAYCDTLKFDHVVATLDTCRASGFNLAEYKFNGDSLLGKVCNRAIEFAVARHRDNSYVYDLIASLYLTKKDIFEVENIIDPWGNELKQLRLCADFSLGEYLKTLI